MAEPITLPELRSALDAGDVLLVDTLRAEHFAAEHLPGAIHLHPDDVATLAAEVLPDRGALVVTYCTGPNCTNSERVANHLTALGYANVRAFRGGKEAWEAAGLPLVRPEVRA